ncbi:probable inactive poly [ADP-ribose] polymerase sro2 [Phtheirospermum japonicum]|uniref:Probable inactive poly [ADP-ribose] polymerase sro2 n=1 Tax=Phtheirospermum japonicum TaxID=374723 RepID=A0A830BMG6_9LAMI|nr:probable inactive poly [ADP-ribose] polymerase sro2 [Phtheirospermum japonicum]
MDIHGAEDQVSMTVHDYEAATAYDSDGDSSPSFSSSEQLRDFTMNGMVRLDQGNEREYGVIKKSFLVGMGFSGEGMDVVAVHKNSYSGDSGQAKLEGFRTFCQVVAARRGGDANVKYGWYGGSRAEICDVLRYGFGRCGDFEKGVSHGVGVYLSPANFPIDSALRAKEDENGVKHMLLCRVILGNTETIRAGSEQLYPSSTDFDSGIDNPLTPRKYIIWSAYMNSHILPNYVISFKAPSSVVNHRITRDCARKPNSPIIRFSILLNALSKFLHPSKTGLVLKWYNDFREHKIDRSELIRRMRSFAGDEVLISAVKLCRDEVNC